MRNHHQNRGYITKYGYRRIMVRGRRLVMEHVLVWQQHHGPVPPGMELHHINGDKLDNRIENLQLVTRLEHKRIHSGCQLRDGVWWKKCRICKEFKPVTEYYQYPGANGVMGLCKICCSLLAVEYKRRRRQRLRLLAMATSTVILPPIIQTGLINDKTPTVAAGADAEVK